MSGIDPGRRREADLNYAYGLLRLLYESAWSLPIKLSGRTSQEQAAVERFTTVMTVVGESGLVDAPSNQEEAYDGGDGP